MNKEEFELYKKQVSENEDTAIKLLKENVELKERIFNCKKELEKTYTNIENNKNVNYIHEALKNDLLQMLEGVKNGNR